MIKFLLTIFNYFLENIMILTDTQQPMRLFYVLWFLLTIYIKCSGELSHLKKTYIVLLQIKILHNFLFLKYIKYFAEKEKNGNFFSMHALEGIE